MKPLDKLLNENPLGTEFVTRDVFPDEKNSLFVDEFMGKKFKYVGRIDIIEGEGGTIQLKKYAEGFDPSTLEDEYWSEEDEDEWEANNE